MAGHITGSDRKKFPTGHGWQKDYTIEVRQAITQAYIRQFERANHLKRSEFGFRTPTTTTERKRRA